MVIYEVFGGLYELTAYVSKTNKGLRHHQAYFSTTSLSTFAKKNSWQLKSLWPRFFWQTLCSSLQKFKIFFLSLAREKEKMELIFCILEAISSTLLQGKNGLIQQNCGKIQMCVFALYFLEFSHKSVYFTIYIKVSKTRFSSILHQKLPSLSYSGVKSTL